MGSPPIPYSGNEQHAADYTSKACPMCGHTADENRPRKGLRFVCQNPKRGYILHADLLGACGSMMRDIIKEGSANVNDLPAEGGGL
jgi:Putative transposase DNA-binding domain